MIVFSSTAPTVAQKYPRAHRCCPQYRFLRAGNSSCRRRDERPLMYCTIFDGHRSRFNFFDSMRPWYLEDNPGLPGEDFQNIIVLSESFWNEVKQHPIPVDMVLVRALA